MCKLYSQGEWILYVNTTDHHHTSLTYGIDLHTQERSALVDSLVQSAPLCSESALPAGSPLCPEGTARKIHIVDIQTYIHVHV